MQKLIGAVASGAAIALSASPAAAYFFTGNQLWEYCKTNREGASLIVMGMTDSILNYETDYVDLENKTHKGLVCLPAVTGAQLTDMICLYLKDHPENRHVPAANHVFAILVEKFPCVAK
jgi:hypothetical protein